MAAGGFILAVRYTADIAELTPKRRFHSQESREYKGAEKETPAKEKKAKDRAEPRKSKTLLKASEKYEENLSKASFDTFDSGTHTR